MLIGKHYHTLEENRRLSLPKNFRSQHQSWIITRGIERELIVFPKTLFVEKLRELSSKTLGNKNARDTLRLLTNEAKELEPDKLGRIQLPEYLIEYAELTKNVVIIGSLEYLEIWDQKKYHQYTDKIEKNALSISEKAL